MDVNVVYYILTANEEFGIRAKELVEEHYGMMVTSALTVWQLCILLRRKGNKKTKANTHTLGAGNKNRPLNLGDSVRSGEVPAA
ncbi:PIN domain-containing protein [Thermococcus sp.]